MIYVFIYSQQLHTSDQYQFRQNKVKKNTVNIWIIKLFTCEPSALKPCQWVVSPLLCPLPSAAPLLLPHISPHPPHPDENRSSVWLENNRLFFSAFMWLSVTGSVGCHWDSYRVVHVPVDAGKPPGLTARWLYFAQQTRMEFLLWSLTTSLEQKQTFLCKQPERHTKKYIMINHDYLCKWTAELFTNDYYYSIN